MLHDVSHESLFDLHVLASPGGIGLNVDPQKRIILILWHDYWYRDAVGSFPLYIPAFLSYG